MLLKGDISIDAPKRQGWDFRTTPQQLSRCVLGV